MAGKIVTNNKIKTQWQRKDIYKHIITYIYSYFEKGCRKSCACDNPERLYGIWSMHLFLTLKLLNLLLLLSFSPRKHMSMASHAILWNFFEKQWTKNQPQYLSRLSRALFSTTFLKTAVYGTWRLAQCSHTSFGFSYPTTTGTSWKPAFLVCGDERMRAQTMKPCLTFFVKGVKIDFCI